MKINSNGDYELIEKGNGDFVTMTMPLAYKDLGGPNVNGFYIPHEIYMKMLDEVSARNDMFICDVGDASDGCGVGVVKMEHVVGRILSIDKEKLTAEVKILKGKYVGDLKDAVMGFNMLAHHDLDVFKNEHYRLVTDVTPIHGHLLFSKTTAYRDMMKVDKEVESGETR